LDFLWPNSKKQKTYNFIGKKTTKQNKTVDCKTKLSIAKQDSAKQNSAKQRKQNELLLTIITANAIF